MQSKQLYFYHQTVKNAVTVFGSLFSNIYTKKFDKNDPNGGKYVPVPIIYQGIPKHRLSQLNREERNMIDRQLPMMSFGITSFEYDSVKKTGNRGGITLCCDDPGSNGGSQLVVGNPSPWIIGMELAIKSKTLDEGFQIVEQILPYFTPTMTVNIKDLEETFNDCKYSRSDITLVSMDHTNDYEGSFEDKRELEWTLNFTMTIPMWGFASGYPGVNASIGGISTSGNSVNNGIDIVSCGPVNPASQIKNIFVNFIEDCYNGQAGPGIPEDPETQEFLPQSGQEGHVSTVRISGDLGNDLSDPFDDEITTKGKNYPGPGPNEYEESIISGAVDNLLLDNLTSNTITKQDILPLFNFSETPSTLLELRITDSTDAVLIDNGNETWTVFVSPGATNIDPKEIEYVIKDNSTQRPVSDSFILNFE